MKYFLLCSLVLIICLLISMFIIRALDSKIKLNKKKRIIYTIILGILMMLIVSLIYLSTYYKSEVTLVSNDEVKVDKIDGGYFFDGPGKDEALIFYPGAKIDTIAYAPLLISLAQKGIDCFLADMPFHMAIFNSDIAEKFINNYYYDNWSASGHSFGGVIISKYMIDRLDKFNNLILLASYPMVKIPDNIKLCSIYGDKDECLDRSAYNDAKKYWPINAVEHILQGANHSQYANYGVQKGDGQALISSEKQQELTVELIINTIRN